MNSTHQSENVSSPGASAPVTALSPSSPPVALVDRPLNSRPAAAPSSDLGSPTDLDTREAALKAELASIQQAREQRAREEAQRKAEEESAASRALDERIIGLPTYLGIAGGLTDVIKRIRQVITKRRGSIPPEVKEQAMLAIKGGATEKEVVERFHISPSTVQNYRKALKVQGRKTNAPVKNGGTKKPKVKKGGPRAKRKAPPPPYPAELKEAVVQARRAGASVPSLSRASGVSQPCIAIWVKRAGVVGKTTGRLDVQDLIREGKVKPFPRAA